MKNPTETVRLIARLVNEGKETDARRWLMQAGGPQANETVSAVMEGQKAELLRLRTLTGELIGELAQLRADLAARDATIAGLREDKARLDWLASRNALSLWAGRMACDGSPTFDICRMSDDGEVVMDHIASGVDIRAAIDAARKKGGK